MLTIRAFGLSVTREWRGVEASLEEESQGSMVAIVVDQTHHMETSDDLLYIRREPHEHTWWGPASSVGKVVSSVASAMRSADSAAAAGLFSHIIAAATGPHRARKASLLELLQSEVEDIRLWAFHRLNRV